MKLLGWMHRKFRQNSTDPFKDQLVIGQTAVDEEHNKYWKKQYVKQSEKKYRRKSFPARVEEYEEEYQHEDGGGGMYELFPGFLAIGTLGSSATPTFAISVENITEKEDEEEATEKELKLINDELEKVLLLGGGGGGGETIGIITKEDHDDQYYYSSSGGRSSHVCADQSNAICPLQGYLLGSGIELSSEKPSKTQLLPNAKKEQTIISHRTSLGELFQRSKLADDQKKEADKSDHIMHLIKKKLKKRILHHHASFRSSSSTSTTAADSDTKLLHKILHMFHKKVHPENSTAEHNKFDKYEKNEKTINTSCEEGEYGRHINYPEEELDIVIHPKREVVKEKMRQRRYKSQSNPFQFTFGHATATRSEQDSYDQENNKEHWIKTDADYLVLEL